MSGIDWMDSPLREFGGVFEYDEDGKTTGRTLTPHGEGSANDVLFRLYVEVDTLYGELIAPEDDDRLEQAGEVPIIREGVRHYEPIDALTLRDLPAVLDTFVVLEGERQRANLQSSSSAFRFLASARCIFSYALVRSASKALLPVAHAGCAAPPALPSRQ